MGESVKGEFLYTGKKYRELESDTLSKFDKLIDSKIEKADKNTRVENTDNNNVDANDRNSENLKKQEWMKEASIEFSGLNTIEELTRYENKEDVIKEAALSYIGKEKIGTTAVLCYRKNTCNEVNTEIRNLKKEEGTISSEIITTINRKEFAENDKIIFLQNDKKLNIKNGMTGIILGGNEDILKIRTEDRNNNRG